MLFQRHDETHCILQRKSKHAVSLISIPSRKLFEPRLRSIIGIWYFKYCRKVCRNVVCTKFSWKKHQIHTQYQGVWWKHWQCFPQITSNILRKNAICGKMQYILYEVQPHSHFSEWQLSLKERLNLFKMMLPILFRRFTHMKWHIACIHPWHASFNKYYIHPRVLLQSNVFIVLMHGFESNSNGSLPC